MKVVIFAGGFGTRISEYTKTIPKPMIKINGIPIIMYIINHYKSYGYKDFYIALGYKGNVIKKYFKNFKNKNIKINLIDTGLRTMTGGRLKRLSKFLKNETFLATYGDGLSNVNLSKLLKLHIASKKIATVTAVHPPARFGEIVIKSNRVAEFNEKIQSKQNWINGGFFVFEPEFLNYIKGDQTSLEAEPLTKISKEGLLGAYKHEKFWQCMDTMKDKNYLEELWKKKAPWK